jgi:hypothetical protein
MTCCSPPLCTYGSLAPRCRSSTRLARRCASKKVPVRDVRRSHKRRCISRFHSSSLRTNWEKRERGPRHNPRIHVEKGGHCPRLADGGHESPPRSTRPGGAQMPYGVSCGLDRLRGTRPKCVTLEKLGDMAPVVVSASAGTRTRHAAVVRAMHPSGASFLSQPRESTRLCTRPRGLRLPDWTRRRHGMARRCSTEGEWQHRNANLREERHSGIAAHSPVLSTYRG